MGLTSIIIKSSFTSEMKKCQLAVSKYSEPIESFIRYVSQQNLLFFDSKKKPL